MAITDLRTMQGLFKGFDDAIKLALAGIKYQDPLDPQDAGELSKTFFSMATAVGMNEISQSMNNNARIQEENQLLNLGSHVGKIAEVTGDTFHFDPSSFTDTTLNFEVPGGISKTLLQITDNNGVPVYQEIRSPKQGDQFLTQGKYKFNWNGQPNTNEGNRLAVAGMAKPGEYKIKVIPMDANDNIIKDKKTDINATLPTTITARVIGGARVNDVNMININGSHIPIGNLIMLQEAKEKAQSVQQPINVPLQEVNAQEAQPAQMVQNEHQPAQVISNEQGQPSPLIINQQEPENELLIS